MGRPTLTEKVDQLEERLDRIESKLLLAIPGAQDGRLLTTEEAAVFLGMTIDGLRGLTHRKLIPYYKPNGKNMYFDVDELIAWQKKHHFEPIGERLDRPREDAS